MQIKSPILILLVYGFVIPFFQVNGQGRCPEFEQFKQEYETGNIESTLLLLQKVERCLKNSNKKLSTDELIEFYKYKTFLYQDLKESAKAEENIQEFMRRVLRKNPDYSPKQNLPEKIKPYFQDLYNKHRYWPAYYLGFKAGVNFTQINATNVFSVDQTTGGNLPIYKNNMNLSIAAIVEIPILKRTTQLYFTPEIAYSRNSFQYQYTILDFAAINLTENQDWIELPLAFKYYFQRKGRGKKFINNKLQPFLEAGFSLNYLVNTGADISRQDLLPDGSSRPPIEQNNLDLSEQRKSLNYALIAGGGVKFKNFFRTGWDIFLEGRFNYGLANLVNQDSRASNSSLLYDFGYIDSDYRMNTFVISLGLLIPKYNPKKLDVEFGTSFD